jgi:hypothetical protein
MRLENEEFMNKEISWLPGLVYFEGYNGNWEKYLEAIYNFFSKDFVEDVPVYQGRKLALKRHPMYDGKEATFWHIISEGKAENDRTPDLKRCERIRWPRPVIENCNDKEIKIWENSRDHEARVCILLDSANYLVVIARRREYDLFWAAYPITWPHHKRKLIKEYEAYIKANAA